MPEKERVFLVNQSGQKLRVYCPESARVTFGPLSIGSKYGGSENANVLRIYEGANKENQYAVFTGVISFRDEGQVRVEKQVKEVEEKSQSKRSKDKSHAEEDIKVERKWEPDA